MARGGLGSAWSLKVAAVWTNLPVSHVTPSVSPGMWEEAAHPRSCHTVSALPFFFFSLLFFPPFFPPSLLQQKAFVSWLPAKGWPPTLSIQSGWLHDYQDNNYFLINFFFSLKSQSHGAFLACCKKVSCLWLYLYTTFNFQLSLTPQKSTRRKHGTKGSSSLSCCSVILKNISSSSLCRRRNLSCLIMN